MYKAEVAVCSDVCTEHLELFNVKPGDT